MVHRSYIIPGLSAFIDSSVLSQYAPTSMKRILGATAATLYLKKNESKIDALLTAFNIINSDLMVDIEVARDILKTEIGKVGFMRITFPILGDIDFTSEDVDALYKNMISVSQPTPSIPVLS